MIGKGIKQIGSETWGGDNDSILVGGFNSGVILGEVGDIGFGLGSNHGGDNVIRSQLFTVVELDALTEMEGPSATVFGNIIAFR